MIRYRVSSASSGQRKRVPSGSTQVQAAADVAFPPSCLARCLGRPDVARPGCQHERALTSCRAWKDRGSTVQAGKQGGPLIPNNISLVSRYPMGMGTECISRSASAQGHRCISRQWRRADSGLFISMSPPPPLCLQLRGFVPASSRFLVRNKRRIAACAFIPRWRRQRGASLTLAGGAMVRRKRTPRVPPRGGRWRLGQRTGCQSQA